MNQSPMLPAVEGSVMAARKFVTNVVAGVDKGVSDALAVIASELASNCVRHGASAFQVSVEHARPNLSSRSRTTAEESP